MLKTPIKPTQKQAKKAPVTSAAKAANTAQKSVSYARAQVRPQANGTAPRTAQNRPQAQGAQGMRTYSQNSASTRVAQRHATTAAQRQVPTAATLAAKKKAAEAQAKKQKEIAAKEAKAKKAAQRKLLAQKKMLAKKKAEEQKLLLKKQAEAKRLAEAKQKELARREEHKKQLAAKQEAKQKKEEARLLREQEKAEERRLAKKIRAEKMAASPVFLFLKGLYKTSAANTENSTEKKRFPFFAVGTIALATVMFMVIVSSFMQISQIQAEMKEMEATIRELKAEERKLSMELEGKYSSKIESVAADMGLSGTYHKTYYLESDEAGNTEESVASDEAESTSTVNSLMSAFSRSFKKFLEFID